MGFFLVFLTKCQSKCPSSTNPTLLWNISCCASALRHYSFCKALQFTCSTMVCIRICLNNCSVICTVILCYMLHQIHSEFWYIQNSVNSSICRYFETYSAFSLFIKFYCLVAFTSWDIEQYVYCNCLLTRLWRHGFWN